MSNPQWPQQPQYGQPSGPPPRPYAPPPPQHYPPPQQYAPPPQQYAPPPQQYAPAPQYGQPPAQQQPQYAEPKEGIAVTTKFFPLAWIFFFIKPKVFVDGYEVPVAAWGRTVIPAQPGQHHLHVYTPYFLPSRIGPADATVDVPAGQLAELEYKAPIWSFSPGALGYGPQPLNGVGITIAIMAIPFAFALLMIIISILASI